MGRRLVAQSILLEVLRAICRAEPSLCAVCMSKGLVDTLLSPKFLVPVQSEHFTHTEDNGFVSFVDETSSKEDRMCVFGRRADELLE